MMTTSTNIVSMQINNIRPRLIALRFLTCVMSAIWCRCHLLLARISFREGRRLVAGTAGWSWLILSRNPPTASSAYTYYWGW